MSRRIIYIPLLFVYGLHPALVPAQSMLKTAHTISAKEAPENIASIESPLPLVTAIPRVTTTMKVVASDDGDFGALTPALNISQTEILSSAGTYGDFARYLQLLPGVVPVSDLSNDVLVRGGILRKTCSSWMALKYLTSTTFRSPVRTADLLR